MKLQINTHIEFTFDENGDLYFALQVENDEFFSEKIKYSDILKQQLKGLTASEKKDCKRRVAAQMRKFLVDLNVI